MMGDPSQKSLSDVLIRQQIIAPEQLQEAMALSRQRNIPLGEALTELGLLSADDVRAITEDILNIRTLKLEDVEIDPEAVHHVPAAVAHRHHLIPIRRNGTTLAVVMSEPSDCEALAALRAVTDFEIQPFLARFDTIEHAIFLHYGELRPTQGSSEAESPAEAAGQSCARSGLWEEGSIAHVGRGMPPHRGATFDNYVEDPANQFALSIAHSIARFESDSSYNPFHLWGGRGAGKTHLLHAIANHTAAQSPLKRCILISSQRFIENLFECIRDNKLNFFRYLYRELDLLMIDDADALLVHGWAQRELHDTYSYLERNKKQLVLASRNNLAAEPGLIGELRPAIESGVIAHLGAYTERGKHEMIRQRAGMVKLPGDVVEFMASRCGDDLGELMRLIQQTVAMVALEKQEITVSLLANIAEECGITLGASASSRIRSLLDSSIAATRSPEPPSESDFSAPMGMEGSA